MKNYERTRRGIDSNLYCKYCQGMIEDLGDVCFLDFC